MTQKRPGGLTALAVLNFVFAGLAFLGVIGLLIIFKLADMESANNTPQNRAVMEAFKNLGVGVYALMVAASVISGTLLLIGGIGYLKSRRWARLVGNLYAAITIADSIVSAVMMPSELGGGMQIGTIINLVYPVLTVILVNTTFKNDLVTSKN